MRILAYTYLCLLALLCSCSTGAGRPGAPSLQPAAGPAAAAATATQPASLELPAPSTLAAALGTRGPAKRSSYAPAELIRQAEDFAAALPHQLVAATASGASFSPAWEPASPAFSGLSFAMYSLQITGYSGDATLNYSWISAPADPAGTYIALADWDSDCWDWYPGTAEGAVSLAGLEQYLDFSGDMLFTVLRTGTDQSELDWLRLGSIPPQPQLTPSPVYGVVPFTATLDASASSDPDGSIAEYLWDPEGDGSFDLSTGSTPQLDYEFVSGGDHQPAVRVVDDDGVYNTAATDVAALGSGMLTSGTAPTEEINYATLIAPNGHLLLFGRSLEGLGGSAEIQVSSVSPGGQIDFVKYYSGGTGNDSLRDAQLGSDGFIYACGGRLGAGLVQKWSTAGELIYSKTYATGAPAFILEGIAVSDGGITCCGEVMTAPPNMSSLVLRLDLDGNVLWSHSISTARNAELRDVAAYSPINIGASAIRCCGYYGPDMVPDQALYTAFDLQGNMASCKTWSEGTATYARGIALTGALNPATYIVMLQAGASGDYKAVLSKLGGATTVLDDPTYNLSPAGLQPAGNGELAAVLLQAEGFSSAGSILLLRFDGAAAFLSGKRLSAVPDGFGMPTNISSLLGKGVMLSGEHAGPLPALSDYAPAASTSTTAWQDLSPSQSNPGITVGELSTALTDLTTYAVNRQAGDMDGFVYMQTN